MLFSYDWRYVLLDSVLGFIVTQLMWLRLIFIEYVLFSIVYDACGGPLGAPFVGAAGPATLCLCHVIAVHFEASKGMPGL